MQATITYTLSEKAQLAQIKATGQPVAKKQTHVIDVDTDDIDLLRAAPDGTLFRDDLDFLDIGTGRISVEEVSAASTPTEAWRIYKAVYQRERQKREAEARKKQNEEAELAKRIAAIEAADQAAANVLDMRTATSADNVADAKKAALKAVGVDSSGIPYMRYPDLPLLWAAGERFEKRVEAAKKEKQDAEHAKEAAKTQFIAEWIADHADQDTQEQFHDGLLSRKTAIELIADIAFDEANIPNAFTPRTCQDSSCCCSNQYVDTVPRKVYAAWRALKANLNIPASTTVKFSRIVECPEPVNEYEEEKERTEPAPIYTAEIYLPYGPFEFKREIVIG